MGDRALPLDAPIPWVFACPRDRGTPQRRRARPRAGSAPMHRLLRADPSASSEAGPREAESVACCRLALGCSGEGS
jgi:hypothetical protein